MIKNIGIFLLPTYIDPTNVVRFFTVERFGGTIFVRVVAYIIKNEYRSLPERRVRMTLDNNNMKLIVNTCVSVYV